VVDVGLDEPGDVLVPALAQDLHLVHELAQLLGVGRHWDDFDSNNSARRRVDGLS